MADEITIELVLDGKKVKGTLSTVEKQAGESGEKAGKEFGKNLAGAAATAVKVGMVALAGAMGTAVYAAKKFTEAAIQQDEAVELLNANLRNMGKFSVETSKDLQAFAAAIERTTTFGDEAVLQQIAFAQSMGATVEQSKKMTLAAIELSVAQKKDLSSSMLQISKTLSGLKGELGETVKEIRVLTVAQLEAGMAADVILKKFSGFSEAAATTFKGRLDQLNNSYGTLLENLGFVITKTPAFNAAITGMKESIDAMAVSFDPQKMAMKVNQFIETMLILSHDIVINFVSPLEKAFFFVKILTDEIATVFINMGASIGSVLGSLETRFFDFSLGLSGLWRGIKEVIGQRGDDLDKVMAKTGVDSQALTNKLLENVNNLRLGYQIATAEYILNQQDIATATVASLDIRTEAEAAFAEHNTMLRKKAQAEAKALADSAEAEIKQFEKTIKMSIMNGVVTSFQAFGKALGEGGNAFEAFGKNVYSAIGGLAMQLGSFFIAVGAGMAATTAFLGLSGGAAIAAGLGLVVLGGVLQGMGGGGGSSASTSMSSGGGGVETESTLTTTTGDDLTSLNESEAREQQQSVQLVVQGSIFNTEETSVQLIDLLNENFSTSGGRLLT